MVRKLYADIVNVPPSVANAVKAGQYFQTSAEVYDDTGEAGLPAGGGCMLRRIAPRGPDILQVKTLDDLPKPDWVGQLKGCGDSRRDASRDHLHRARPGQDGGQSRTIFGSGGEVLSGFPAT